MRGGKRVGAGRKRGFASKSAEEARKVFADLVRAEVEPIAQALIARAKKGEVAAAKELFDRAWGRAPQKLDLEAQEPLTIQIVKFHE